jgi:hypothetical protein
MKSRMHTSVGGPNGGPPRTCKPYARTRTVTAPRRYGAAPQLDELQEGARTTSASAARR